MTTSVTHTGTRGGRLLSRLLVSSIICGAMALVLLFCVLFFGSVDGEEFDPFTFERRTFYYYEIPIVGVQIIPVSRDSSTSSVEQYIQNSLKLKQVTRQDWHLVSLHRFPQKFVDGDAALLCASLDVKVDGQYDWLRWSKKHPSLAKVLWPAVVNLARNRMYLFIPQLLESARSATDATDFEQLLNQQISSQYRALAQAQVKLNKHLLAANLFDQALFFEPDNEKIKALRTASIAKLTEDEKSRLDTMREEQEATNQILKENGTSQELTAEEPAK